MFKPSFGGPSGIEPHSCTWCRDILPNAQSQSSTRDPKTGVVSLHFPTVRLQDAIRSGCTFLALLFENTSMREPEQQIHVKFDPPNDLGNITSIYSPSHTGYDFDILAPPNDHSGNWVRSREPTTQDLRDPNVLQKAYQWLSCCKERHTACHTPKYRAVQPPQRSQQPSSFFPTRLVRIDLPNTTQIQLVQPSQGMAYAVLGFHKNGREPGVTVQSNFMQRHSPFPIEGLPKSIQDGIVVARALGFQYIWIDSLCMMAENHAMVRQEQRHLDQIIQGAELFISAARSPTSVDGFLGPCPPLYVTRLPYRCPDTGSIGTVIAQPQINKLEPLHLVSYTLQEHLLAKRLLVFGTFGLRWVCQETTDADGVQANAAYLRGTRNDGTHFKELVDGSELTERPYVPSLSNNWLEEWFKLVSTFMGRHLPIEPRIPEMQKVDSRLLGVAAMASAYSSSRGTGRYLAGLWQRDLQRQLLWQLDDRVTGAAVEQHNTNCPSWSWAATPGQKRWVQYQDSTQLADNQNTTDTLEIINTDFIQPTFADTPFGPVKPGFKIQVAGYLAPVQLWEVGEEAIKWTEIENDKQDPTSVDRTHLWRWREWPAARQRCALLMASKDHPFVDPDHDRPIATAILDFPASSMRGNDQYYCLEVYGGVPDELDGIDGDLSAMMNKGSNDPRLDDDTYQLYSVGLLLRYEGRGATFSRVGVYVVEEPGPEEADLVYDNKYTRELVTWMRSQKREVIELI